MTPSEALMWAVERDPVLRSTFLNITMLDRPPDMDRLAVRIGDAVTAFPRMRQRVRGATAPWDRPRWIDDASFDLNFHIRRVSLPPPGSDRMLFDLSARVLEDAFDPVRPLWQLTVVEGLEGGRAALLAKMHHTITDGVGGLRLSSSFLDFDAAGHAPVRVAPTGGAGPEDDKGSDGYASAAARALRTTRQVAEQLRPDRWAGQVRGAVDTVASVLRQGIGLGAGGGTWQGARSMGRRLDRIDLDLDEVRTAAKALGGTVNDLFVCGVVSGAADYHRAEGHTVEHLRVAVPVSTRVDRSFGGNSFAPARLTIPVGDPDVRRRFQAAHLALASARSERALTVVDRVAGVLLALPPAVLTPMARQQVSAVDLAASNLRGSPVELFVAGAGVLANYPMGPTAGVAFNATVLSYMSRLDLGLDVDVAAVADPDGLRACLEESFAELVAAGHGGRA
jgi:diacylglycerol O-acyltransferase